MVLLSPESSRADFLRGVPLFAGISDALRDGIAARSSWIHLPAGEWLFRQGEAGDSLYLVACGRLEVVLEQPAFEVVRILGRNDLVGELALLTGAPRSASVRARRDSELLRVTEAHFAELLRSEPEFALALTRALGERLRISRGLPIAAQPLPATVAVVPLRDGLPVDEVAEALLGALNGWGRALRLDGSEPGLESSGNGAVLDRCERDHDQVLLVAAVPDERDPWTDFCLREADRVIALAGGETISPWAERCERLRGCDLLFCTNGSDSARATAWLDALEPRSSHRLVASATSASATSASATSASATSASATSASATSASATSAGAGSSGALDALARRLAGRSVGIVLSGGGARGLAHIGVLEEILSAGITIDRVAGCSMGAFVGGMFAMGLEPDEIRARCHDELVRRNPLNDYTVPIVSLVRGHKAASMLTRTFGTRTIEELPREFFCVSCDLLTAELVVHRRGPVAEAAAASMCVPGVIAPIARGDRLLVDGGILNNLPVHPMAESGEGPVIAVDVTAQLRRPALEQQRPPAGFNRIALHLREVVVGNEGPLPNLKEIITRAIGIASVDAVEAAREEADVVITPETGSVGMLDFRRIDWMIEAGRRAARAALKPGRLQP
jgi:NTE family protein